MKTDAPQNVYYGFTPLIPDETVRKIRAMFPEHSKHAISRETGVSRQQVRRILSGEQRKGVK